MATCNDCFHWGACKNMIQLCNCKVFEVSEGAEECEHFTPTADVVEIVRCEKCKYGDVNIISKAKDGEEDIACYCTLKKVVTNFDSYCPSGRRRDT